MAKVKIEIDYKAEMDNVPELPEDYMDFAHGLMANQNVISYYRRGQNKVTYHCHNCGTTYEARIGHQEDMFDTTIYSAKPEKHHTYICGMCEELGTLEQEGRYKDSFVWKHTAIIQEYGDKLIFRFFEHHKQFNKHSPADYYDVEKFRVIIDGNKVRKYKNDRYYSEYYRKIQEGYYKRGWYFLKSARNEANIYHASIYPGSWDILEQKYRYLNISDYYYVNNFRACTGTNTFFSADDMDIIETYVTYPGIEILNKQGYTAAVKKLIRKCGHTNEVNKYRRKMHEVLRVRKEHLEILQKKPDDWSFLKYLTKEDIYPKNETEYGTYKAIFKMWDGKKRWDVLMKYMTPQKALNRMARYSNDDKSKSLSGILQTYTDYLNMRETLGYDMTNSVYIFPRNLYDAHQLMVDETRHRRDEKHIVAMTEKYNAGVQKRYKGLCKKYKLNTGAFVFMPAQTVKDIIMEGRNMHHCVGGENYLKKHSEGKSAIVFMRYADKKEECYITIEVAKGKIIQWYCAHDKKADDAETLEAIKVFEEYIAVKKEKKKLAKAG